MLGFVFYTGAQGALARASEATAASPELLEAMARAERPYITALWSTGNGTAAEAEASVARLAAAWSRFEAEEAEGLSRLEGGASALAFVTDRIREASSLAVADPLRAHEVLEQIRLRLREVRVANGLDYFPDRLTAYHEPMEAIVLAAKSGGEAGPGPDAVATIRTTLPAAREAWAAIEAAPHDNSIYGLTGEMLDRRQELLTEERAALDALGQVLEEDPRAIRRAATALKPVFARLVLLYGARAG